MGYNVHCFSDPLFLRKSSRLVRPAPDITVFDPVGFILGDAVA